MCTNISKDEYIVYYITRSASQNNKSVFKVVNKGYINKELSMYLMNAYEIKEIIVFFNLTQIIRIILVPSD